MSNPKQLDFESLLPINYTPHPLKIIKKDVVKEDNNYTEDDYVLIKSDGILRVTEKEHKEAEEFNLPFIVNERPEYEKINPFPDICHDAMHPGIIVSTIAADKIPDEYLGPVFIPDSGASAIRDEKGNITHIKSLSVVRKRKRSCDNSSYTDDKIEWTVGTQCSVIFKIEDELLGDNEFQFYLMNAIRNTWSNLRRGTRTYLSGEYEFIGTEVRGFEINIGFIRNNLCVPKPHIKVAILFNIERASELNDMKYTLQFLSKEMENSGPGWKLGQMYRNIDKNFTAKVTEAVESYEKANKVLTITV